MPINRLAPCFTPTRSLHLPRLKQALHKTGFVIVKLPSSNASELTSVAKLFGSIQKHIHNPETGITEVVGMNANKEVSQVASITAFSAHTDGSYLHGLTQGKQGNYTYVGPPSYVLLQCVKPASSGGTTFVVDAQKILRALITKKDPLLPLLFSPIFSIGRGTHLIMDTPIFSLMSNNHYKIRFSYDKDLCFARRFQEEIARFNAEYIQNPVYTTGHLLQEREIAIIDNFRCLHARSSFTGERILRRLWVYDNVNCEEKVGPLMNEGIYYESAFGQSFTKPYDSFTKISSENERASLHREPGIKLPGSLKKQLQKELTRSSSFKHI